MPSTLVDPRPGAHLDQATAEAAVRYVHALQLALDAGLRACHRRTVPSTSALHPNGRERNKIATRRALRAAALELGLERGWAAVRIEDVAALAGVSTRT